MMADLPGVPGVILLGGATRRGQPDLSDTWTFDLEGGWLETTAATLPTLDGFADLTGNAFAFDGASGLGVFVDIKGNPWVLDLETSTWSEREPGAGPTALLGTATAFDSDSGRMILFGGLDLTTFAEHDETWAYDPDADSWQRMTPEVSPAARNYVAMAYDEGSDRVILFGGAPGSGTFGDTWAYDFETDSWTEMSPAVSPPARTYSAMVYDRARDRMILYGGSEDQESGTLADTWAYDYDVDTWTPLPVDGPSPRGWHSMAIDNETGVIVLFGGGPLRQAYTDETWLFDPAMGTWSQVP